MVKNNNILLELDFTQKLGHVAQTGILLSYTF